MESYLLKEKLTIEAHISMYVYSNRERVDRKRTVRRWWGVKRRVYPPHLFMTRFNLNPAFSFALNFRLGENSPDGFIDL